MQEIEWLVLEKDDDSVRLITKECIDAISCRAKTAYSNGAVSWGKSEIFKWLNDEFFVNSFTAIEKDIILTNEENEFVSTLDEEEVIKYFPSSSERQAKAAPFIIDAHKTNLLIDGQGNVGWWIKTDIIKRTCKAVNCLGEVVEEDRSNSSGKSTLMGIRPVIRLKMK